MAVLPLVSGEPRVTCKYVPETLRYPGFQLFRLAAGYYNIRVYANPGTYRKAL